MTVANQTGWLLLEVWIGFTAIIIFLWDISDRLKELVAIHKKAASPDPESEKK